MISEISVVMICCFIIGYANIITFSQISINFLNCFSIVLMSDIIRLNIGGTFFTTTRTTLMGTNASFFSGLLDSTNCFEQTVFIDRDPTHFRWILNLLRGSKNVPFSKEIYDELKTEADFYCIDIPSFNNKQGVEYEIGKISNRMP